MATLTYEYQVRDRAGKVLRGHIDAESPAAVATRLKSMGYAPINISASNSGLKRDLNLPGLGKRVKLKDLAVMSRQFATMINSGLSLLRALNILSEQTENTALATVLAEVRNNVEAGAALSVSLGKHPKVFPPLMVNMIKAGEVGGFLDQVLLQIAVNYEAEVRLRGKVKAAMTYPIVVFCIAILAVIAMLLFIVPTFAGLFTALHGTLPAPTRILVVMSHVLRSWFALLMLAGIGAAVGWAKIRNEPRVRNFVDPMKLRMPVFGGLFQKIALSRFTRNLGTMIKSGVPILQALDIVADTSGNVVIARASRDVQQSVRTGESLSAPLARHAVFPPMVVQMLAVGEDTGNLDEMLFKIAEFYDQEVESTTESLTAQIEPLMIAFLGGIVGSMIVALYMPIFKIFDLIK
jgi:type IV pilus assembly protein PilC